MSKLLLNEQPLLVMPKLATKIGLNESLILQQIHYWNEINTKTNNNFKDGYYWTYNSYESWTEQFPFWSTSTIKRAITKLEKSGLVVVGNYNKLKIDRTKWYRIDYKTLESIENSPLDQIDLTKWSKRPNQEVNLNQPLPETITENKTEIKLLQFSEKTGCIFSFLEKYSLNKFNKNIRKHYKNVYLDDLYDVLMDNEDEFYEFIGNRIKTHDQCSLEYIESIQGDFSQELYVGGFK